MRRATLAETGSDQGTLSREKQMSNISTPERIGIERGRSERLGPVTVRDSEDQPFLGREIAEQRRFSEHTAQVIHEEVSRILRSASDRALEMLTQHRAELDSLAKALEAEETLDDAAIEKLLGPPASKMAEAASNN